MMKQRKGLVLLALLASLLGTGAVFAQAGSHSAEIGRVEQLVLLAEKARSENRIETAKQAVQAATALANKTRAALQTAQDAVKSTQDALNNIDTVTIGDVSQFKADMKDTSVHRSDFMTDSGADVISTSSTSIRQSDKTNTVTLSKVTTDQQTQLSQYAAQVLTAVRKQLGVEDITVTDAAMKTASDQAKKYAARGVSARTGGHLPGDYTGENISIININNTSLSMYDLKQYMYNAIMGQTFADAPSKWGHMANNLKGNYVGISVVVIDGELHIITVIQTAGGTVIVNNEDPTTLQANLTQAQGQLAMRQAEDSKAKELLGRAQAQLAKTQPNQPQTRVIYRLYHAASEQYFYTKSLDEAALLKGRGWKFEGRGFQTATSGKPVYRLYHAGRKAYLYTSNVNERDKIVQNGWKFEGVAWYSSGTTKVYRLFNPKAKVHMYTASWKEVQVLKARGWKYEGASFYTL